MPSGPQQRVVVLGLDDVRSWSMPGFEPTERDWIHGGERTLMEIAAAAAVSGFEVELRGSYVEREVAALERAAGVTLERPRAPRLPVSDDLLVIPEGMGEALYFARAALSPARVALAMLGPPGLCGWPLDEQTLPVDTATADPDAVGRPEQFRAARSLGFELWTNTAGLAGAATAAGAPCRWLGVGRPTAYPPAGPKHVDVVTLADSRWAPAARRAVAGLRDNVVHEEIPRVRRAEMLARLGGARVLIHPAPIEGRGRLIEEAMAMGVVVVGLRSSRFAEGMDSGGVLVDRPSELAGAVHDLLDDPPRLLELSARGMQWARAVGEWPTFVARVADAIGSPDPEAAQARSARGAIGSRLAQVEASAREELARAIKRAEAAEQALSLRSP